MFVSRQASAGYPDKQKRLHLHEPDTSLRFSGEQKKTILCISNWGGGKSKGRKVKWCIWAGFCQTIGDLEQKNEGLFLNIITDLFISFSTLVVKITNIYTGHRHTHTSVVSVGQKAWNTVFYICRPPHKVSRRLEMWCFPSSTPNTNP